MHNFWPQAQLSKIYTIYFLVKEIYILILPQIQLEIFWIVKKINGEYQLRTLKSLEYFLFYYTKLDGIISPHPKVASVALPAGQKS